VGIGQSATANRNNMRVMDCRDWPRNSFEVAAEERLVETFVGQKASRCRKLRCCHMYKELCFLGAILLSDPVREGSYASQKLADIICWKHCMARTHMPREVRKSW
jgi:hypothetical protein